MQIPLIEILPLTLATPANDLENVRTSRQATRRGRSAEWRIST
jgi:hypothetical protein